MSSPPRRLMPLGNTPERWGLVSRSFHWLMVALVITQFALGYLADDLPLGMHKLALLARHKSIGITVLGFAVLRLGWRWQSRGPGLPGNLRPIERRLAQVTHGGLYVCLFAMPLTGWLMSSAKKYPVSWFGLAQLPDLVQPSEALFRLMNVTHKTLSYLLLVFVVLHVAGALRHQFILKDNLMRRMLLLAGMGVLLLATAPRPAYAETWVSDAPRSNLTFTFTQAGAVNGGRFEKFSVQLQSATSDPTLGALVVTIDVGALDTGDGDRDTTLRGNDLFDVTKFPTARFVAARLDKKDESHIAANGRLTLRGITRALTVPLQFRKVTENGQAVVYLAGAATLHRLDFGVGRGDWKSTEWVGNDVPVTWNVRLIPAPAGAKHP